MSAGRLFCFGPGPQQHRSTTKRGGSTLHTGYIPLPEGVLVRQDLMEATRRFDALVFDVDGVLLDVSASYYTLAADTVNYYFKKHLGWPGTAELAGARDFFEFNKVPGFNDVVDMVRALILLYLWKAERHGTTDIDRLTQAPPSLDQFRAELTQRGGRPSSAVAFVGKQWAAVLQRKVFDFETAEHFFCESYAGSDRVQEVYGLGPRFAVTEPYFRRERILVDRTLFPPPVPFGIITGRRRGEVVLFREHFALSESALPWERVICSDSEYRKPDPEALRLLVSHLGASNVLYFGDTVDDFEMARRYDASRRPGEPVCFFVGVTKERESMSGLFAERRVPFVTPRADAVLRLLRDGEAYRSLGPD